jgi:hypothetical protein
VAALAALYRSRARSLNEARIYRKLPPVAGPAAIAARALMLALAAAPLLARGADVPDARAERADRPERAEMDGLVRAVVATRGLPYRGTLPVRTLPRDEVRAAIRAALRAGTDDPAVAREVELLRRLGLVPGPADGGPGDYPALLAAGYTGAPAPFYDVATGRLLVPDVPPLGEQRPLLIHEIAHAVTDQRFGIRRTLGLGPEGRRLLGGDAHRARLALVEGDAMLTGLATIDPRETFLGPSAFGTLLERIRVAPAPGLPAWAATTSHFSHADGLRFTATVRAANPWRAVDDLWADPPSSTEQVLHPARYQACDEPVAIGEELFPALPDFGRPTASDVLGELVVRTWLARALPPELAERAAEGWGGDRAALYARPRDREGPGTPDAGAHAPDAGARGPDARTPGPAPAPLLWLTVWDDDVEAADFARAATAALAKLVHAAAPASPGERTLFVTAPGMNAGVLRRADVVALFLDVPDPALAATEPIVAAAGRAPVPTKRSREATPARPRGGRPRPGAPPGCPRRDRAAAPR